MDRFVCVRIVQMGGADLATFQFDPFLSWAVFLMHPDKTIYGRYGTASPQANRNKLDSNPNHSVAGIVAALRRALLLDEAYRKDPATRKTLAAKTGAAPPWPSPEKTPSARKYKRPGRVRNTDTKGCIHCHEVQRMVIDSHFMSKRALPDRELWVYPLPSILGLTLSKDHCARVTAVEPDSAAAKAGLQVGDDIRFLDGQPLCSVADLQWVLHTFPDEGGTMPAKIDRKGASHDLTFELADGWRREGDFGWRYRVAGYAMWLWGGVSLADDPKGVRVARRSPGWFKKSNREPFNKLQRGDLIVEVDGKSGWTRSTYLAYLMREKQPGAKVKLKVVRQGETIQVDFKVPRPRPEVMGH